MTTLLGLVGAIHNLTDEFRRADVVGTEGIVIELSLEAGARFEAWVLHNAPPLAFATNDWGSELTIGDVPYRELRPYGFRIRWPVELMAAPDGSIKPRPYPVRQP